jgi:hypothetical protein
MTSARLRWFGAIGAALLPVACDHGSALRARTDAAVETGAGDLPAFGVGDAARGADAVFLDATSIDAIFLEGAVCPDRVAVLDVCGCGCCGGQPEATSCYYPALGQTREAIPNPVSPNCASAGCSFGERHLCCADPGETASDARYCARGRSSEDYPAYAVSKQDGAFCTNVVLVGVSSGGKNPFAVSSSGWRIDSALYGPCDGPASPAIGGLGTVIRNGAGADGLTHLSLHMTLFFDSGAGVADSVRFDVADVILGGCFPEDGGVP